MCFFLPLNSHIFNARENVSREKNDINKKITLFHVQFNFCSGTVKIVTEKFNFSREKKDFGKIIF